MNLPSSFLSPPREFSVMPFWFWNDTLDPEEILRQIKDFQAHGVHGFVIHPRIGLPHDLDFMSDEFLDVYEVAIEEAARRGMYVFLYDEAMYPSGSAGGQVVKENPDFACRCLQEVVFTGGEEPPLEKGDKLVSTYIRPDGSRAAVIDTKANSVIRGIHYIGEGPKEETYPASDLLNPEATATFIRLVYDRFAERFSHHFGKTVLGIFTDEPMLLGRGGKRGVKPGTTGILNHVERFLGYDFTPHLPCLFDGSLPDAERFRTDYHRALERRLEETYYSQLRAWCEDHGIALTGHPHKGDDIGVLRHFHIPGQDLVWRWVLPDDPTALEGVESTQAKCSSSAALHGGRRRNANECCGAYGHHLTWEEMNWLANWCFIRGVNLLFPHAFYYSIRGVRIDERPPDVGPNSPWWDRYGDYAIACQRLSWLNTDSTQICELAILGRENYLPWKPAKTCFQHQFDFNYLEERDLLDRAVIDESGIHIAGMTYKALIIEDPPSTEVADALLPFAEAGRILQASADETFIGHAARLLSKDIIILPPSRSLRLRRVQKDDREWIMIFNEESSPVQATVSFSISEEGAEVDLLTGRIHPLPEHNTFQWSGYEMKLFAFPLATDESTARA